MGPIFPRIVGVSGEAIPLKLETRLFSVDDLQS